MIYISAGEIPISDYAHSERKVYIGAFWIDKHPVTNTQYKKFIDATGYRKPDHWEGATYPKGKENHPVIFINWYEISLRE